MVKYQAAKPSLAASYCLNHSLGPYQRRLQGEARGHAPYLGLAPLGSPISASPGQD